MQKLSRCVAGMQPRVDTSVLKMKQRMSEVMMRCKAACVQIASALSRPEEASSARATDTPAAAGAAAFEGESFLSPDEALHSIHEEPEEAGPDQGDPQAPLELAEQGQSRKSSFTQNLAMIDRQSLQRGRPPARSPTSLACYTQLGQIILASFSHRLRCALTSTVGGVAAEDKRSANVPRQQL